MSDLSMNSVVAQRAIEQVLRANKVPFLKGPPGIGKSAIINTMAKRFKLKMIDIRLPQYEPPDMNGFPTADHEAGKSKYLPMDTFPLEGDELPEGYDGWFIFIDELPSASKDMQACAYKLILDRMVGQKRLHSRCMVACAGNNMEDEAVVYEMSSALSSRLIHLHLRSDFESFRKVMLELDFDHRIRSFMEFKPNALNNFDPEKLALDDTYACERTWHFLSDIMKQTPPDDEAALFVYSGTLGQGIAREFIGFCKVYHNLPSMREIIATPERIEIPTDPGTLYALTGSLGQHAKKDNIDQLMKFIFRMPLDFQVVTLRQIIFHDRSMMHDVPAIQEWISRNSSDLF